MSSLPRARRCFHGTASWLRVLNAQHAGSSDPTANVIARAIQDCNFTPSHPRLEFFTGGSSPHAMDTAARHAETHRAQLIASFCAVGSVTPKVLSTF